MSVSATGEHAGGSYAAPRDHPLVPLLMALYFVNYLDRTNLGIAKTDISARPPTLGDHVRSRVGHLLHRLRVWSRCRRISRWSASAPRRWLARIAVSWGIVAVAIALRSQRRHLCWRLRFLLGVAEAGLFPGVIFYLCRWFPAAYRARIVGDVHAGEPYRLRYRNTVGGVVDLRPGMACSVWPAGGS